jgi:thioredoxin reductase
MKKAIVVGSGIAGIASAIRQNKGYKVKRKNSYPEESSHNLTEMVLDLTQVHHFYHAKPCDF